MNTKLWELKEMVDGLVEKLGEGSSLNCDLMLKTMNLGYESGDVDVLIDGLRLSEWVEEKVGE
jgi:hypothetical protein